MKLMSLVLVMKALALNSETCSRLTYLVQVQCSFRQIFYYDNYMFDIETAAVQYSTPKNQNE